VVGGIEEAGRDGRKEDASLRSTMQGFQNKAFYYVLDCMWFTSKLA
jgi:hypothetical protein